MGWFLRMCGRCHVAMVEPNWVKVSVILGYKCNPSLETMKTCKYLSKETGFDLLFGQDDVSNLI